MRRHATTAILAVASVLVLAPGARAASTYATTISSTPGLMSFWRLDEQGAQANAEGLTAVDATGADSGTYHLGVNLGVAGSLEGDPATAAHFGTPDGYVSIPAPSFPGSGQFTIEGWVNLDAAGNNLSIVGDGAQTTQHTGFLVDTQNYYGQPALDFVFGDGTSIHLLNGQVYTPGAWYYFAGTYDGSVVRWYLDGVQVASTMAAVQTATTPLLVASNPVITGSGQLSGSVDDVALYGATLSATTIQQHYQLGITDGAPPTTSLQATPPSLTNQTSATFQFSSPSVTPSFQCQLDGAGWQACASPDTIVGLSAGTHHFSVRAVNRAGQADPGPPSASWTVQTALPSTTVSAGPAALTSSTLATFAFASPTGVSFRCQLDRKPAVACSSPYTITDMIDGPHTLSVYATDEAGNVATIPAQYSWSVDTSAPTAFIVTGPSALSPGIPFVFTANKTGVSYVCQLDGSPWAPCSTPFTGVPQTLGVHSLAVRARDGLGNLQPQATTYSWNVTATPSPAPRPARLALKVSFPRVLSSVGARARELSAAVKACRGQPHCVARARSALTPRLSYRVSVASHAVIVVRGPHRAHVTLQLTLTAPKGSIALPASLVAMLTHPGRYTATVVATGSDGASANTSVAFTVRG